MLNIILTGITRFDLLGDFGRFNWLGNFYIVLSYNLLFAIMTTLCLVRKFTSAVREELLKALGNRVKVFIFNFDFIFPSFSFFSLVALLRWYICSVYHTIFCVCEMLYRNL